MIKKLMGKLRRPQHVHVEDRFYGGDGTIHSTGHVDVVLDVEGNVSAVWFRCALLPFKQSDRRVSVEEGGHHRAANGHATASIKGIVFEDVYK